MIVGVCIYVEYLLQQYQSLLKAYWFLTNVNFDNNNLTFSVAPYQSLQNAFSPSILFLSYLNSPQEFDLVTFLFYNQKTEAQTLQELHS